MTAQRCCGEASEPERRVIQHIGNGLPLDHALQRVIRKEWRSEVRRIDLIDDPRERLAMRRRHFPIQCGPDPIGRRFVEVMVRAQ